MSDPKPAQAQQKVTLQSNDGVVLELGMPLPRQKPPATTRSLEQPLLTAPSRPRRS